MASLPKLVLLHDHPSSLSFLICRPSPPPFHPPSHPIGVHSHGRSKSRSTLRPGLRRWGSRRNDSMVTRSGTDEASESQIHGPRALIDEIIVMYDGVGSGARWLRRSRGGYGGGGGGGGGRERGSEAGRWRRRRRPGERRGEGRRGRMFDSLINTKFYNRCKHAFKCIRTRLVVIRRKKQAMIGFLKKDVAELISNGHDTHAFNRVDELIIEMNQAFCYDKIEEYCDFLGKQLNSLQKQRECPPESREAVSTLIFAAARFPDLPELRDLRHIFTGTFGSLEPFVSNEFVRKLESDLFTSEEKFQVMQSVAEEFSVGFDAKALQIKLWAAAETGYGFLEKDSVKEIELVVPLPIKQKDDGEHPLERKSEATPVGHKQKVEEEFKPKDAQAAQAVDNCSGRLNDYTGGNNSDKSRCKEELEKSVSPLDMKRRDTQNDDNTGRLHTDKPDCKEHLEKSVSPIDTRRGETRKQFQKFKKKDTRPPEKELMEAVELDIDGLPKHGSGSDKFPETENSKIVPPSVKPRETKKEHCVEKENDKGLGYHHRSPVPVHPEYSRRHANVGCKTLGQQNFGPSSLNSLSGRTTNRSPPNAKPNVAKVKNCDEKEETKGLAQTVQNGQGAPQRAANVRPPYVNPKFAMQPVSDKSAKPTDSDFSKANMTQRTDHPANKHMLQPVSVRRKKSPAPVDAYDETPEKVTSQRPSSHRIQQRKHKGASDGYDDKGDGVGAGNGRDVERAASSRPSHSGRRNRALHMDDYDGSMQRCQAGEDEGAIDFGNLLPRSTKGHHRLKSRNSNVHDGDLDEEERMMDKLLMHYSKKGLHMDETKTRAGTSRAANCDGAPLTQCQQNGSLNPPGRAVSLPPLESVGTDEAAKVPARSTSLRSQCPGSVRVHPKMPDFEELAARVIALRNA
uniref:Uncharacterized protein n=1 Tax=Avena sativa TaxID=4498 RepID=A0ACD5ZED6_AVESA